MSRSRRHTPVIGNTTARSEKHDKRLANRRLRRMARERVDRDPDVLPVLREVSNPWSMAKDGRRYCADLPTRYLRK